MALDVRGELQRVIATWRYTTWFGFGHAASSPAVMARTRLCVIQPRLSPFLPAGGAVGRAERAVWVAQHLDVLPSAGIFRGWHGTVTRWSLGSRQPSSAGFSFTAARNWTALPTPRGATLAGLAALWLAGRVLLVTGPGPAAAAVDVAFLPLVALALWLPLRRSRNRNQFFGGILLLFAAANLAFHLAQLRLIAGRPSGYVRFALYVVVFIVSIMAGRVVPSFTKNAIPGAKIRQNLVYDRIAIGVLAAALLASLGEVPPVVAGLLAVAAAILHAVRLWRWDPWCTRHSPILWILHLSYAWIPGGLLLLGLASFVDGVPAVLAVHALGVGAAGGMIIGMITRTALGHSGRPLRVGAAETASYALVHVAALLRVVPALLLPTSYPAALVLSVAAWSLAFLIYAVSTGRFSPGRASMAQRGSVCTAGVLPAGSSLRIRFPPSEREPCPACVARPRRTASIYNSRG